MGRRHITLSDELEEFYKKEAESAGLSVPSAITFALLQYKKQSEAMMIMGKMEELIKSQNDTILD